MIINWESILILAAGLISILGAWRSIITLKRDIMKSMREFVCAEIESKIKPFIQNQADVLRYNITRAHSQYMSEGSIDKYTLQALEALYRDYHAMNQNGFVDTLINELRELPTKQRGGKTI